MISIAIDGPSGSGKSTISDIIAKKYGLLHVDTGALYRTVGLYVYRNDVAPDDIPNVVKLLETIDLRVDFKDGKQLMYLGDEDVTPYIRTNIISSYASKTSAIPQVRAFLLDTQRNLSKKFSVIMDGRDIGTVILPDADLKIFMEVNNEEKARRRWLELQEKGEKFTYEEVLKSMLERDSDDKNRKVAPAIPADDAIFVDNSGSLEDTLNTIYKLIDKII